MSFTGFLQTRYIWQKYYFFTISIMASPFPFIVLDSVESTNNYAMYEARNAPAEPGTAWFSPDQTGGKGQRGKKWVSEPGMGISLSILLAPGPVFRVDRFHFSAFIAISCYRFLKKIIPHDLSVKWPNDLYWRDRKAGGILIENIVEGNRRKWAVAGIGINVNQLDFPEDISRAVSLQMINGHHYDVEKLARELHREVMDDYNYPATPESIMEEFNEILYRRGEEVSLMRDGNIIRCRIRGVDEFGRLQTDGDVSGLFSVGEVSWL